MENVLIENNRWVQTTIGDLTVWFCGYIEVDGQVYHPYNIEQYFQHHLFYPQHVEKWHGEFAIVCQDVNITFAAVDRKRSIPLFYYRNKEGTWQITDHLDQHKGTVQLDDTSVYELIVTGYVSNERTLSKDIYQLEAGQYLLIEQNQLTINRYFRFFHQPDPAMDEADALKELEKVFHSVFDRLVKRLSGQPIMLPLSGGYDSRIIALLLKEYDVKSLSSFTYGKPNNREAMKSKEIAEKLGIPWEFYSYSKPDWFQWYRSEKWVSYVDFSSNLTSIPHLQDWPAVKQMMQNYDGPLVFVPGHTGDFISGGHIPADLTMDKDFTRNEVIEQIMRKHHRLWDTSDQSVKSAILVEIEKSLTGLTYSERESASAAFEYWNWKERQAKFIINSVRVYEFFGQNWAIPLWDDQLINFFLTVPVHLRYRKYLYNLTLHQMYPDYFPRPEKELPEHIPGWKQGAIRKILRRGYTTKLVFEQYHKDQMDWFGITGSYLNYLMNTRFKYKQISFSLPYNINSFIAKDYIEKLVGKAH